jgi:probable F420-dependent oxidoreductase
VSIRVGLSVYDIHPRELVDLAVAAEAAGFASLWLGEHVVLPLDYATEHPATTSDRNVSHRTAIIDPSTILVDPLVSLAAVAEATERITLATGIYLLPLRHPLAIARMTVTLQLLAGGRFMLGVGSGWLREEFDALGVPFDERGARFDETLAILRAAWAGGELKHDGACYRFDRVLVTPDPIGVPLILGGNTERALRRAARVGDGWFSSGNPTLEEAIRLRTRLEELSDEAGRQDPLPIYVRMSGRGRVAVERYGDLGFEHVTVWANELWPRDGGSEEKRERFLAAADELLA